MTTFTHVIGAHSHVIGAHSHVIPAKAGIHPAAPKPPKRRPSSRPPQNPTKSTESDKIRRKLVCARSSYSRARARARHPLPSFPHTPTSFPRRRESSCPPAFRWISLGMNRIRHIAWICRPIAAMPINHTEPPAIAVVGRFRAYEMRPPSAPGYFGTNRPG